MDLKKIGRNNWIVLAGFLLTLIGLSMSWYTVSIISLYSVSANGWNFGLGVVIFLLTLAAAALALLPALAPSLRLPFPSGLAIMGLGGLSLIFVFVKIVQKPGSPVGYGAGIFLALISTAIVTLGGFLKNGEPAS